MLRYTITLLWGLLVTGINAQVYCDPVFPNVTDDVTIYFHADEGTGGLTGVNPVFAHMGVITNLSTSPSDWKHVPTTWGVNDPIGAMTLVSPNVWKKTFNITTFFNIPANETVLKLAFVFRNTNGSLEGKAANGSDIFYPVYPDNGELLTTFVAPSAPSFLASTGEVIPIEAAASQPAALKLLDNGVQVATGNGELMQTTINAGAQGLHTVLFVATTASTSDTSSFSYFVPGAVNIQNPPAGTEPGIQYLSGTSVRLSLYAPNKGIVHVIGDFNNWQPNATYQMNKSVDGNTWWIDITGLQAGDVYRFQYLVDGALKIADPYSTLILDPWNDGFIPAITYPDLPPYPSGQTFGIVSVLTPGAPTYNWQVTDFQRPKKTDLVVYELLLRDFLARHDYETLTDTLDYLQTLGVNVIELMPVNEFEGNISWGYNPDYHMALDKYYGTPEAFKTFVDACHARGIAVVLDAVFNHATGLSPLAQLYWDAANNRPAANNPWLNPVAKHDFNVFNDFNHESPATKAYLKNCVAYWLEEYHIDGFRFDLSKGFTQKNTLGNTALWGVYDATRIAIWKDYADFIWATEPGAYVILEHFADNNEEKELGNYGMMLWGNMVGNYKDVALGFANGINTSLSWIDYKNRGWSAPHVVGYMESHDEERIGYQCLNGGNSGTPGYNIKTLPIAMRRIEMAANLFYTVPGPKMLWEFGELGYDYSINWCTNGTISTNCRLDPKPIRWDYAQDPSRKRLHDVVAALIHLRTEQDVFETTTYTLQISSGKIRQITLNSPAMNAYVVVNIGTTSENTNLNLNPTAGWWYEYYTGDSVYHNAGVPVPVTLLPGEYRLYLDHYVPLPPGLNPTPAREVSGSVSGLAVYPNPVSDRLFVDFTTNAPGTVRIEVFDLTGRRVAQTGNLELEAGDQNGQFDTALWTPGLYFVKISDDKGGMLVRKCTKL